MVKSGPAELRELQTAIFPNNVLNVRVDSIEFLYHDRLYINIQPSCSHKHSHIEYREICSDI